MQIIMSFMQIALMFNGRAIPVKVMSSPGGSGTGREARAAAAHQHDVPGIKCATSFGNLCKSF